MFASATRPSSAHVCLARLDILDAGDRSHLDQLTGRLLLFLSHAVGRLELLELAPRYHAALDQPRRAIELCPCVRQSRRRCPQLRFAPQALLRPLSGLYGSERRTRLVQLALQAQQSGSELIVSQLGDQLALADALPFGHRKLDQHPGHRERQLGRFRGLHHAGEESRSSLFPGADDHGLHRANDLEPDRFGRSAPGREADDGQGNRHRPAKIVATAILHIQDRTPTLLSLTIPEHMRGSGPRSNALRAPAAMQRERSDERRHGISARGDQA